MKINNNYEWSTHQPLLSGLLDTFKPNYILELGIGIYSTPIFVKYKPEELLCIDNDEEWLNKMLEEFKGGCNILLHKLDDNLGFHSFPRDLSVENKNHIVEYYGELSETIKEKSLYPKMLFVDNFTCCRTLAINTLCGVFDVIAYHDCQPAGIIWYGYNFVVELKNMFNYYILKTPISWTGAFIRQGLDQSRLSSTIIPYISKYCTENGLHSEDIYLEKQY